MIQWNEHVGETIVVLGNGPSLRNISPKILRDHTTIGVNEICRYFDPDYVVLVDSAMNFRAVDPEMVGVRRAFRNCEVVRLPCYSWGECEPFIVGLGESHVVDTIKAKPPDDFWDYFDDEWYEELKGRWIGGQFVFPLTYSSMELAVLLAFYMGASRVCLLGQDYYGEHFYQKEVRAEVKIGRDLELARADAMGLAKVGKNVFRCELVQLNPQSAINTIPVGEL